jgi:hypothetical protein
MLILAGAAVPLAIVSVAYGCGILATVHLNHSSVAAGSSVSALGGNYSSSATASAVTLRFNSRTGAALWTGRPDANGSIHATFTAPTVSSGYYVIDATQTTAAGAPVAGTPGRAVIHIGNASKGTRHAVVALWPSTGPGPAAGSHAAAGVSLSAGPTSVEEILVALLSASLLAGGLVVLAGDRRRGRGSAQAI